MSVLHVVKKRKPKSRRAFAQRHDLSLSTFSRWRELEADEPVDPGRTRKPGGGRKRAVDKDESLLTDVEALVEPTASGDPCSPLRWNPDLGQEWGIPLAISSQLADYRCSSQDTLSFR